MKHKVNLNTWSRRDNWNFMRTFANSWYSVTSEVDCTVAMEECRRENKSFFIRYLYAMLRAANEIKEFGYRPDGDGVCWYDSMGATVPVAVEGGTFYTVLIGYVENYDEFYKKAKETMANIPKDGDPYGVNRALIEHGDTGVVNISATPRLYFSSVTYTFHKPGLGSDWPLMNVGKAVRREGRWVMPVGLYVDHCFVDGVNLSDFVEKMQCYLDSPDHLCRG
ncbi:CatA-like O-acetyltransferase [Hallella colorans]|uniref:CatA-like O-acetyltransferase n=1 Tax=Hallella colorans TaxID=1703337 RepID=UPI002889E38E|nr:CatA-like O-acetyltransferase [Hallella colorans]